MSNPYPSLGSGQVLPRSPHAKGWVPAPKYTREGPQPTSCVNGNHSFTPSAGRRWLCFPASASQSPNSAQDTTKDVVITDVKPSDPVLISCISPCGRCQRCRQGLHSHCEHGGWTLGNTIDGTQVERVRTPFAGTSHRNRKHFSRRRSISTRTGCGWLVSLVRRTRWMRLGIRRRSSSPSWARGWMPPSRRPGFLRPSCASPASGPAA
jgi:hypothetical protein